MPSREARYRTEYDRDIRETGDIGRELMGSFTRDVQDFNPDDAFNRRMSAAQDAFQRRFTRDVRNLRASQASRGRTRTGFAFQDEDRLFEDMAGRFAEVAGGAAMQTTAMDLNRIGMVGSYGDRFMDRGMTATGGEYHTHRAQRLQEAADKRQMWADIVGSILGAGGTVAGAVI